MSADLAARLRELARDHHDGRLDLAAYRSLRAPLLDSLVPHGGAPSAHDMEVTQPRSAARVQPGTTVVDASESGAVDSKTSPGRPGHAPRQVPHAALAHAGTGRTDAHGAPLAGAARPVNWLRLGTLAAVVGAALIATAAWWLSRESPNSSSQALSVPLQDTQVHDLVEPFVERGDWSDGRLAGLNTALLELGSARVASHARERWFQHFIDELRMRLKEQQALSPHPLTIDNSPLAALAVTVGLDLSSPDAAIHIPTMPPADAGRQGAAVASPLEEDAEQTTRSVAGRVAALSHASSQSSSSPSNASPADTHAAKPGAGAASVSAAAAELAESAQATRPQPAAAAAVTNAGDNACRPELVRSRRPMCQDTLPGGTAGPLLALIPAGAFDMGGASAATEQPVHRVRIREPFAISVHEVSQAEFRQYCEHAARPCSTQPWAGDDYPVVNVSWEEARAYTEWLSSVTRYRYRLPTEAQWEYAARAGQSGAFPSGDTLSPTDAHYSMVTKQPGPARRAQKFNANAFRLMHTLGNVREWVEDVWAPGFAGAPDDGSAMKAAPGGSRVVRGGSYADGAARVRLSVREGLPQGTRDAFTGFRVVRELQ